MKLVVLLQMFMADMAIAPLVAPICTVLLSSGFVLIMMGLDQNELKQVMRTHIQGFISEISPTVGLYAVHSCFRKHIILKTCVYIV